MRSMYIYKLYIINCIITLLTKITAAQNEDALNYHRLRGLYFPADIFAATIFIVLTVHHRQSPVNMESLNL